MQRRNQTKDMNTIEEQLIIGFVLVDICIRLPQPRRRLSDTSNEPTLSLKLSSLEPQQQKASPLAWVVQLVDAYVTR